MPFGKHKGSPLSALDTHYLDWLIGQEFMTERRNLVLHETILQELQTRPDWHAMDQET